MSPVIISLYLIFNGTCSYQQVGIYITEKRLLVVSSSVVVDAGPYTGPVIRDFSYKYYQAGDTVLAVRKTLDNTVCLQIQRFFLTKERIVPIDAVILTSSKCL